MLARTILLVPALLALTVATATDAEARRFKLFSGSSRSVPSAKPDAPAAARAAPSTGPAASMPTDRSGTFVYIGGRGAPAAAPAVTAPADEQGRRLYGTQPAPATVTAAPTQTAHPGPEKVAQKPFTFDVVSAHAPPGFAVVRPR
jgi:hypothetical protein